jgi:hypothetical protein
MQLHLFYYASHVDVFFSVFTFVRKVIIRIGI